MGIPNPEKLDLQPSPPAAMSLSSLAIQRGLFFLPYLNIALVGFFLLATATDNIAAALLGTQLISNLFLYSNHYTKVYSFFAVLIYFAVFVLFLLYGLLWSGTSASETLWHFRIPELILLWWVPQIGSLVYVLVLPSINEILPDQLYLGNLAAASTPVLLKELKITHILELHDGYKMNDPAQVQPELLQLCCSDYLGSDQTLVKVAPQAIQFMDKVLEDPNNRLLVHCAAGGSRSPAMVVVYLVWSGRERTVANAVRTVRRGRPFVDISSDHLDEIERHHQDHAQKLKEERKKK